MPKLVHLEPTGDAFIPGVPAVPMDVTEAEADTLLAWTPPAFVVVKEPGKGPAPAKSADADPIGSEV